MNTENQKNVLVFEDDLISSLALSMILEECGLKVLDRQPSADAIMELYEKHQPDLVLLDISLKGKKDGVTAAKELRALSEIPIVFLSAYNDDGIIRNIREIKNTYLMNKPYNTASLENLIKRIIEE